MRRSKEIGKDPYLPIISTKEDHYLIDKVAVFDKTKFVATLNPDESVVLNQLITQSSNYGIHAITSDDVRFSLTIESYNMKYKFQNLQSSKPKIELNVKIKAIVEETTKPIPSWRYQEAASEKVKEVMDGLLVKCQKNKVDPVGFGLNYYCLRILPTGKKLTTGMSYTLK